LSNCKKPDDIGLSTLPADDLLYTDYADSATILTTTIREDSLRADELSRILFGSIHDAVYGQTNVDYFGQILLSSTPNLIIDSGLTRVADSLVLSLVYSGWYGDTTVPQHVHVYRLTEDMYTDSTYYSGRTFQTDVNDLEASQAPFAVLPNTQLIVGTDSFAAPQLRIRLNDSIRDSIFGRNSQPEFASNDNWKVFFKGVHITVDPITSGGALLYFNPAAAYTRMTLYYHEDTIPKSYSFTLAGGARLSHASHDFTGSVVEAQLNDTVTQFDFNYLQPLAGLKTKVTFPYLKHFSDSGSIVINKAELVITVPEGTSTTNTPAPDNILLLARNSSDSYDFPIDYYERSYGGAYNITNRTYTFGITRTVQHIVDGTSVDYGYTLNVLGSMIMGNSATIGSGKTGDSQMKLKLYYTKLH